MAETKMKQVSHFSSKTGVRLERLHKHHKHAEISGCLQADIQL